MNGKTLHTPMKLFRSESDATSIWSVALPLGLITLVWMVLRWRFFFGFLGYDDLWYANYASKWGATPINHWEVRVLFTGLIRLCTDLFGKNEFGTTAPALASSLVMLFVIFRLGWKQSGLVGACIGGALFALLPQDIFSSTSVDVVALTSALSSVGILVLLEKPGNWGVVLSGIFLGLAIFSHFYALLVVGAVAFAWLIHSAPVWRWKESTLLFLTSIGVFLLVNSLTFYWMTGSVLFPYKVSAESHLQTFGDIVYNLSWLIWPLKSFVFTNEFGILLLVTAGALAVTWRKANKEIRFLGLFSAIFFLYVNWGTQLPTQYLPLWHLPRYWYPLAVPVCVTVGYCLNLLPRRFGWVLAISTASIQVLMILMAGPWGQNVEVSKTLLHYAQAHPKTRFATDGLSLNEMFVLNGCTPPANIFPIRNLVQPEFYSVPESSQINPSSRPLSPPSQLEPSRTQWICSLA